MIRLIMKSQKFPESQAWCMGDYDWRSCEFIDVDFSGVNVSEFDFSNCHFINCDMTLADFTRTKFKNCVFRDCDLRKSVFERNCTKGTEINGFPLNGLHIAERFRSPDFNTAEK